ncbi:MAG TPA: hypothetical protein VOA87_02125, partial [Thermoanaerobaculia bacterium]|nr:hypothetical protein [Thermoanaerobaculia bacterium]
AGAAVLLEPDPGNLAATAAWARPTLLAADAAEALALRRAVEAEWPSLASRLRRRWHRSSPSLPFGRLRVLLVPPGGLPAGEASFWEGRGVRLVEGGMV